MNKTTVTDVHGTEENFASMLDASRSTPEFDCGAVFARDGIPYGGRVSVIETADGLWKIYFHYNSTSNGDGRDLTLAMVRGDKDQSCDRAWKMWHEIAEEGKDPQALKR